MTDLAADSRNSVENESENPMIPAYKVTPKKTLAEYSKIDENDDSLRRWKESLGINVNAFAPLDDPRNVVILFTKVEDKGGEPLILELDDPAKIAKFKDAPPMIFREGGIIRTTVRFRVQHNIVTGLRVLRQSKRMGVVVHSSINTMGSFAPNTPENPYYEVVLDEDDVPSGMMVRGTYDGRSKYVDDDGKVHCEFLWSFQIKKNKA